MSEPKVMNRWGVVIGAILIQLCLGAIYAWAVFTPALTADEPWEIAAAYNAPQLGLDQAAFDKMAADLKEPSGRLKELNAKLKGETDKTQLAALKEQQKVVQASINTAVRQYVPAERLDKLAFGLSNKQSMAIFSAGLAAFAVVMVLAGRMMPKLGPRKLAMAGGVVLGLGYLLAGLVGASNFWITFALVGLVGGAGIGLAYVVPIGVGMKWFPDKKGMITGLAVAGFGFGALLWVKLAGQWGHLIADFGVSTTWIIYGVTFMVAVIVGGIWMVDPPAGWLPAGYTPPEAAKDGSKPAAGTVDFTSGQMLATPQFYMILLCFVFGGGAGLMSIGLMKAFPMKAMMARGMDWQVASAAAGTAMAVFFSLANGIGRIAWGTLSDKLGRKNSIVIMLATQGVIVILFQWMAGTPALLYLGATLIGFNFGGNFALFPTITADTFGVKYVCYNYGWVFLGYGIGGILGPIMGGALGDMGNFPLAFTIAGACVLAGAVVAAAIRAPQHKPAVAAEPATAGD